MKYDTHIMLDLETMDAESNKSAIVSIGAVEFDFKTGYVNNIFYKKIDLRSSLDMGFIISPETIYWWLQQNEPARLELVSKENVYPISKVLQDFSDYINSFNNPYIWGNGISFDISKISAAFHICNIPIPWNFRNERDVRTLVSLAPNIKESTKFIGIEHHPVHDCLHQIKYCVEIYNKLNLTNPHHENII